MKMPFQLYKSFNISIIEDSIENVEKNLSSMLQTFQLKKKELDKVHFSKVCGSREIPYNPVKIKFILFEPSVNPGTTVFFPNFTDGWHTAMYGYACHHKKNVFQVGFSIDEMKEYPAYFFNYYHTKRSEFKERVVHAVMEDKWVFYQKGEILQIEDGNNYTKRKISNRINNAIIITYLKRAGYDMDDQRFYLSSKKAILFSS